MKAAIFAHGRGSFAFTAGRLCSSLPSYDITIGSGNGAMLAAFAVNNDYDMLHNFIFNTVGESFYDKSITNRDASLIGLFKSIIRKKLIRASINRTLVPYFKQHMAPIYYKIMTLDKRMYVVIYNASKFNVEVKEIPRDVAQGNFVKFLLTSIMHPVIFPNHKIGSKFYRSAASVEPLPIMRFMDLGIKNIDIYTNLPHNMDMKELSHTSPRFLDDNSKYLQAKELYQFMIHAEKHNIRYRIFYMPPNMMDLDAEDTNKYFNIGYTASDILFIQKP